MSLPTDLNFTVAFDRTNSPANFQNEDTTPYSTLGIDLADIRGNFTNVIDPLGNVIHNNTSWSSPDIVASSSLLYTGLNIPTDTNGDILEGQYAFTYNIKVDNPIIGVNQGTKKFTIDGDFTSSLSGATSIVVVRSTANNGTYTIVSVVLSAGDTVIEVSEAIPSGTIDGSIQFSTQTVYSKIINVTYEDVVPVVNIQVITDCFCGNYFSEDRTDYTNCTIVSRTHTVKYPAALNKADVVSSGAAITVTPIYTKTWTSIVESEITISLTGGGTISALITGSKDTDVECDLSLCDISCCMLALNNRYLDARTTNTTLADKYFKDLTRMIQLAQMFRMAFECDQHDEAQLFIDEIKKVGNCTDACTCTDDEPQQVIPICGGSVNNVQVIAGTGITVTTTFQNNNYVYQVGLSSSIMAIINSVRPQNVVAGTGISVAYSLVGGVDTWTVTNTATYTAENRLEFLCRIQYTVPGAPVCTIANSAYLYSGSNINTTATVANSTIGLANGKYLNNLFNVSAFQVSSNNNYKVTMEVVYLGMDCTVLGLPITVTAANMYNVSGTAKVELVNKQSGNFDFRFTSSTGQVITNNSMTLYPDIYVIIKISQ